jgi:hypothetical protein
VQAYTTKKIEIETQDTHTHTKTKAKKKILHTLKKEDVCIYEYKRAQVDAKKDRRKSHVYASTLAHTRLCASDRGKREDYQ